ncbi:hypothetical protein SEUCBS139899_006518 [Sporothrix eucalyptigena]|uniref:AB hydrolase-1 domain-containing protein n=1 Tax=Sporothrix eucalyptigena TaxID=1812306 RepID=A0ABP0B860_9PEZI
MAAPIKAGYLDTPLGQVHYYYSSPVTSPASLKPPMLLMHMSASSAKSFLTMMPMLTALGYSCYAPDMPGFGGSFDPASDPPSISWYAQLYYEAIKSQLPEFSEGCHIIGHHSGGILGMEFSSNPDQFPGFVKSLTIVGASVMTAADRAEMSKTFLEPFNKPVSSGEHLGKTWEYLKWEGLKPETDLVVLQREAIDHIRAWKGRNQIYSCVWKYERMEALDAIPADVPVAGLCAPDDVLWPYYGNFKALVTRPIETTVIKGGNFGPDLDPEGILDAFLRLIGEK